MSLSRRHPYAPRLAAVGAVTSAFAVVACLVQFALAPPARAAAVPTAAAAAQAATAAGCRTGIAVLDLTTGEYTGAGEDTTAFPSESVVKVLIATQLLLSGRMSGDTATTAYRMITASDDGAANQLYPAAGGDDVLPLVAAHYGITDLGTAPATPGRWGLTQITAHGVVELYAAIARDPAVHPWLQDAMAHLSPTAADGTDQVFGLAAASPGAAVKQGWGLAGFTTGDAVTNSTGYVEDGRFAVAILTQGPPGSYGPALQAVVTAEAQALMPGGRLDGPAPPVAAAAPPPAASSDGQPAVRPASPGHGRQVVLGSVVVLAGAGATGTGAVQGSRFARERLRRRRDRRRLRAERAGRRPPTTADGRPAVLLRLPSGQLVRVSREAAARSRRLQAATARRAADPAAWSGAAAA